MLIEQSARSEGGDAEQLIEPDGLTWKLSMRLPHMDTRQQLENDEPKIAGPSQAQPQRSALAKLEAPFAYWRFLVVEDESLIALDLVGTLERLGAGDVRRASTEHESLLLLEQHSFDCALLDANLHGRPVENIAVALTRRAIPFVFVTGYGRAGLPAAFQQTPVLTKPINDDQLLEAVTTLMLKPSNVVSFKS
jgi:CheY-like chemotaxis protein